MPQLDHIIIFPQIFWFFIFFLIFYIVVTHYFLPKFLLTLKSRKKIVELNNLQILKLLDNFEINKIELIKKLYINLNNLKFSIYFDMNHINMVFRNNKFSNPLILNKKIIEITKNIFFYCNNYSLGNLLFFPIILNLKNIK